MSKPHFDVREERELRRPAITNRAIEMDDDLQPPPDDDAPSAFTGIVTGFMSIVMMITLTIVVALFATKAIFGVDILAELKRVGQPAAQFNQTATPQRTPLPTPAATPQPLGVDVAQAAEREQVPMPMLPTLAPAPPVPEPPTAVPTPLPLPTAEILPQPTQPAAVTVVALPPLYQHPDTGNLYPSGPTATLEPLPTPPPPVPASEYRVVWVVDPSGGQKECVVYDGRRACSFAGIQPGSIEFLAGALKSGLMPGEPHDASREVTQ